MGFGLLLCGYFVLTLMTVGMGEYSFAAYIIGGMVALKATLSLKDYNPRFSLAACASAAYVLLGVYHAFGFLDTIFLWGIFPAEGMLHTVAQAVGYGIELAFHGFTLWSVMELAGELNLVKIKSRAQMGLVLAGIWGLGQVILVLFPAVAAFQQNVFPKMILLFALLCYVLNTFLLYTCYQNICPAGEEHGTPTKRSRFALINKINDKLDEKSAKALRETMEYRAERQKQKEEKKKNKNRKK